MLHDERRRCSEIFGAAAASAVATRVVVETFAPLAETCVLPVPATLPCARSTPAPPSSRFAGRLGAVGVSAASLAKGDVADVEAAPDPDTAMLPMVAVCYGESVAFVASASEFLLGVSPADVRAMLLAVAAPSPG